MRHAPLWLLLAACRGEDRRVFAEPEPVPRDDVDARCGTEGATRCESGRFQTCLSGSWSAGIACEAPTPFCDPQDGCRLCSPGIDFCAGDAVWACGDDGTTASLLAECPDTEECAAGACRDRCDLAAERQGYLGCAFTAVAMRNLLLDDAFADDFGIVLGNPDPVDVDVEILRGGSPVGGGTVPARSARAFELRFPTDIADLAEGEAFSVRASRPLSAVQMNPLHFAIGDVYAYTNDGSLLLPDHALGTEFIVPAFPTIGVQEAGFEWQFVPSEFALAAIDDNTTVTLSLSAPSTLSLDVYVLQAGDVLHVAAAVPADCVAGSVEVTHGTTTFCRADGFDLSGSRISASAPIAVFAGHRCTFAPFDRFACDHLEESVLPVPMWGREAIAAAPPFPGGGGTAPSLVRVLSGTDGNVVTFEPEVVPDIELGDGESFQFQTDDDVRVSGSGALMVTQVILGQDALQSDIGDPSMTTAAPRSQWRSEYEIEAPYTYEEQSLVLVAPTGSTIWIDGVVVESWQETGIAGLSVARPDIEGGAHRLFALDGARFGATLYGYAPYTSYALPPGMDLRR